MYQNVARSIDTLKTADATFSHAGFAFLEKAAVQYRYIEYAKTVACIYNTAIEAVERSICSVDMLCYGQ